MTSAPLAGTEFSFVNMSQNRLRVAGGKLLFIDAGGNSFEVNEIGFHKGDYMTVFAAGLPPRRYSLTRQQDLFDWLWDNNKTHMIAPTNKVFARSGTPVAPPCAAPAQAARAAFLATPMGAAHAGIYGSPPPGSKFYYPTARAPAKSCPECAGTGVYVSQISGRKSPCSMCKP